MYCKICEAETDDNAAYCADCKAEMEKRQEVIDNYYPPSDGPPAREHHTFLRIYLVAIVVFKLTVILSIVMAPTSVTTDFVEDWNPWAEWSIWVDLMLSFVLIGFAIAVSKWRWWGICGFIATAVTSFVVDMVAKPGLVVSLWGWLPTANTITIKAALIAIHVSVIGLFLIALWQDKSNGWRQPD